MKRTFKNITLIALLIVSTVVVGQKKHLAKGDEFFNNRMYKEAITAYKLALDKNADVNNYKMAQRMANTYHLLFHYEAASKWYHKASTFTKEVQPQLIFDYAQLLCNLEDYKLAKTQFKKYFNAIGKPESYKKHQEICDWAIQHKSQSRDVMITKTNLETGGRSMGLIFYKEGIVYAQPQGNEFTSKTVYSDLAYAKKTDTAIFNTPTVLQGNLNNHFYEGSPSFSKTENRIFYTGNATEKKKYRTKDIVRKEISISKNGLNTLHIYESKKIDEKWIKGESLNINGNDYDCVFPHITNNGKRLYFASNMPNGYGGFDLYYSDLVGDNAWGKPINLGSQINTALDEMYPYTDMDTLYFSSKGLKGFGGSDIYKATINGHSYSSPKNLGKPYNSSKDDFSFIINNKTRSGYFSSNREGQHGYDNIYEFNSPKKMAVAVKSEIVEVEIIKKIITDSIQDRTKLALKAKPKKDKVINIDNIYFDYDKSTIKDESIPMLTIIMEYLIVNPTIKVELSAHTDSRAGDNYNLVLSSKRAQSVVSYLISKGIDKSRLIPKGYGESKLVNNCTNNIECSEAEHQENRRVELKIL